MIEAHRAARRQHVLARLPDIRRARRQIIDALEAALDRAVDLEPQTLDDIVRRGRSWLCAFAARRRLARTPGLRREARRHGR